MNELSYIFNDLLELKFGLKPKSREKLEFLLHQASFFSEDNCTLQFLEGVFHDNKILMVDSPTQLNLKELTLYNNKKKCLIRYKLSQIKESSIQTVNP